MATAGTSRRDRRAASAVGFPLLQRILVTRGSAQVDLVADAPADAAEMSARGIAAPVRRLVGAEAATVAFGYPHAVPVWYAALAAPVWGSRRAALRTFASCGPARPVSRVVTLASRALFSVVAVFTFVDPLVGGTS
jgi:hypothetical protein